MNEVDLYRLGSSFFSLLGTISEDGEVKQNMSQCVSSIQRAGFMNGDQQVKHLCDNYVPELLNSPSNPLKEIRYTLVTKDERSVKDLLGVFELFGIEKSQISIDLKESQLFIDRETGTISNSHKDYPKEKSEDKGVGGDDKTTVGSKSNNSPRDVSYEETPHSSSTKTKSDSELTPNPSSTTAKSTATQITITPTKPAEPMEGIKMTSKIPKTKAATSEGDESTPERASINKHITRISKQREIKLGGLNSHSKS